MTSASENGHEVAPAVDDPQHLDDVAGRDPVENDIRRNWNRAHLARDRRPVVANPALRRRRFEQATPIANALGYRIRSVRAIVRDEAPDGCEVAARRAGEAVTRQSVFSDRRFFAKQFAKDVLAVNEVAAIGCFDALLNVGPKPLVERIALRVVHVPGEFRDPAGSAILAARGGLLTHSAPALVVFAPLRFTLLLLAPAPDTDERACLLGGR
jgi:hypothetical protein